MLYKILETLMEGNSVCIGTVGIPIPENPHIIVHVAVNILAVMQCHRLAVTEL